MKSTTHTLPSIWAWVKARPWESVIVKAGTTSYFGSFSAGLAQPIRPVKKTATDKVSNTVRVITGLLDRRPSEHTGPADRQPKQEARCVREPASFPETPECPSTRKRDRGG